MISRFMLLLSLLVIIGVSDGFADDLVPGKKQENPIALVGGTVITVSGETITNGTVVFDKGKITAVGGADMVLDDATEKIDVTGKNVYPGIIAPITQIGLVEIGAVRATRDYSETGEINPNVVAATAYTPDSDIIPTVRSNGVTTAMVTPTGGLLSGTSSIINLDGWTIEDAAVKMKAGIHLNWPRMQQNRFGPKLKEAEKKLDEQLKKIEKTFQQARQYAIARKQGDARWDARWESMMPLFDGTMPLFVSANEFKQIEAAIAFCRRENLKMILVGGADAWRLTDVLKEQQIPVIVRRLHSLPQREDDAYDRPYQLPAILDSAGISFCLSIGGSWLNRNVPFLASTAVAFGLEKDKALRAITLSTAEILGVADRIGSIEVGKDANLIVSTGDIMEIRHNNVVMEFIQGRRVDLNDRHKRLYQKYLQRYGE